MSLPVRTPGPLGDWGNSWGQKVGRLLAGGRGNKDLTSGGHWAQPALAGLKLGGEQREHAELLTQAQHTQHGQPRKDKGPVCLVSGTRYRAE